MGAGMVSGATMISGTAWFTFPETLFQTAANQRLLPEHLEEGTDSSKTKSLTAGLSRTTVKA